MFVPFLTLATTLLVATSVQADMIRVRREDRYRHHHKHTHSDRIYRLHGVNATQLASIGLSGSATNETILVNGTLVDTICANDTRLVGNDTFGGSMNATLLESLCATNSSESIYSAPIPSAAYSSAPAEATMGSANQTIAEEEEIPFCDEEDDAAQLAPSSSQAHITPTSITAVVAAAAASIPTESSTTTATASQSSSAPASPSGATEADITAYLKAHNDFRSKYNARALTWDAKLAAYAQAWGDKCSFKHSGGQYGENLAAGTGNYPIASAVKAWTDEANTYDFSSGEYDHFTQVVWKSTTAVGCSASKCTDLDAFGANSGEATFYVCSYNPPGNYLGEFKDNVEGVTCASC
ncbi:Defense-related protein containing SCP domain [Phaffia rhodozyma]|uniref:Defense-related protein containing SCP domain n=1 Tax=Phaffia rhodozyma TaxID=264483 RepID=A0A0F7SLL5_PHARH|nr:Defense-related protein containing SCP domain [Phaffia rhodozyma]